MYLICISIHLYWDLIYLYFDYVILSSNGRNWKFNNYLIDGLTFSFILFLHNIKNKKHEAIQKKCKNLIFTRKYFIRPKRSTFSPLQNHPQMTFEY